MRGGIRTGINYSQRYEELDAAVAAGATLDELYKWLSQRYPRWFMATVIAWKRARDMIETHAKAAEAEEAERRSKRKGKG